MSTFWRIAFRYGSQFILVFSPMLTMKWSLVDFFDAAASTKATVTVLWLAGPKDHVELQLRMWVSAVAFVFVIANELLDVYLPHRRMTEFRKLYLPSQGAGWRRGFDEQVRNQIRINIMHVRRPALFPFIRVFDWTWNDGFAPPEHHRDSGLFLTEFQGVCGLCVRSEEPKFVDLRNQPPVSALPFTKKYLLKNDFRLFYWQLKKTQGTQAILSIPLFREQKNAAESNRWKTVGVINLDSWTPEGAEWLSRNQQRLVEYFVRVGKILACLR